MSIGAKERLIEEIKANMVNDLTVAEMERLMAVINKAISGYTIDCAPIHNNGNDDMLDTWLSAMNVEGKSKKTLKLYRYVISRMLKKVSLHTYDIAVADIRKYLSDEKARGISDKTLNNDRNIFSSYFGWLYKEGLIKKNPISNIKNIKSTKKVKAIFSDVDIELIKSNCKTTRDIALVTFMLSTGCRVGEVVELNRDSVNFQSLTVKVHGKGDKERTVYLDSVSAMFLKNYLQDRTDADDSLFMSRLNHRISICAIQKMLKAIEKKSGVNHIHPHKFRRTLATNLHRRGMPIEKIKEILGHDNINTTMQYIVLDQSDIEHDYRKFA